MIDAKVEQYLDVREALFGVEELEYEIGLEKWQGDIGIQKAIKAYLIKNNTTDIALEDKMTKVNALSLIMNSVSYNEQIKLGWKKPSYVYSTHTTNMSSTLRVSTPVKDATLNWGQAFDGSVEGYNESKMIREFLFIELEVEGEQFFVKRYTDGISIENAARNYLIAMDMPENSLEHMRDLILKSLSEQELKDHGWSSTGVKSVNSSSVFFNIKNGAVRLCNVLLKRN